MTVSSSLLHSSLTCLHIITASLTIMSTSIWYCIISKESFFDYGVISFSHIANCSILVFLLTLRAFPFSSFQLVPLQAGHCSTNSRSLWQSGIHRYIISLPSHLLLYWFCLILWGQSSMNICNQFVKTSATQERNCWFDMSPLSCKYNVF